MDDALKTVPGVTSKMLVKFGENDIKTVEDLAGCATDDLVGWTERKEGGEPTKHPGILDANEISRDDAESMIMQARVIAGWITEADLAKQTEEAEALKPTAKRGRKGDRRCSRDMLDHACCHADPDLDNGPRTDRSATDADVRGHAARCGRSTN